MGALHSYLRFLELEAFLLPRWGTPRKQSPAELRRYGVVYLDQNDGGDAVIRVDEAKSSAGGVERLRDDDAADYCGMNVGREIVGEKMGAGGELQLQ